MAQNEPNKASSATDAQNKADANKSSTNTSGNANTTAPAAGSGDATGGNTPTAPNPESIKTGQVPGGADTQKTANPSPAPTDAQTPVVQKDFPRPEDSANAEIAAALNGDDSVSKADLQNALLTKPVTDGEWRKLMAADGWPMGGRPFKLVRGKHDGQDYFSGERISGTAGDGQIFALSKRGYEAFGDKFVQVSDEEMSKGDTAFQKRQKEAKAFESGRGKNKGTDLEVEA